MIGAPLRPLAVIAGAGSGKSETMAARLVWLVANGLARPERVLGLTFTRKAAAELAGRVRSRLDGLRRSGRGGLGGGGLGEGGLGGGGLGGGMNSPANRSSPPITPMPACWSATTRCARRWSRRCA